MNENEWRLWNRFLLDIWFQWLFISILCFALHCCACFSFFSLFLLFASKAMKWVNGYERRKKNQYFGFRFTHFHFKSWKSTSCRRNVREESEQQNKKRRRKTFMLRYERIEMNAKGVSKVAIAFHCSYIYYGMEF